MKTLVKQTYLMLILIIVLLLLVYKGMIETSSFFNRDRLMDLDSNLTIKSDTLTFYNYDTRLLLKKKEISNIELKLKEVKSNIDSVVEQKNENDIVETVSTQSNSVGIFKKADSLNNMQFVKGGSYLMGKGNNSTGRLVPHEVELSDFYIGVYEVTEKQYYSIVGSYPNALMRRGDNYPVNNVNWNESITFCNKLNEYLGLPLAYNTLGELIDEFGNSTTKITLIKGYRLPTEAEWEYAARGGVYSKNFLYAGSNDADAVAWYFGNTRGKRYFPVGLKMPNELGLYDCSGNLREWCYDYYSIEYYNSGKRINPIGPLNGNFRVLRGGGYGGYPNSITVSKRYVRNYIDNNKKKAYNGIGLRIARSSINE